MPVTASTSIGPVRTCVGSQLEITSTASGLTCHPRFSGTWGRCQPVTVVRDSTRTHLGQDGGPRRTGIAALQLARSSRGLTRWGAALRNCLATMGSTARGGRSVFVALTATRGAVRAAGELRRSPPGWELEELLGPGHSRVDDVIWDGIRALLERDGPAG